MIQRPVTEHLEVLGDALTGCGGVVEAVLHRHAINRQLFDTVDVGRGGDTGRGQECWSDVDHVMELGAQAPGFVNGGRPLQRHRVAGATKV